jgi:hypothetical protein
MNDFNIDTLRDAIPNMSDWAADKARNLSKWYLDHDCTLTEKQWAFARRLVNDANNPRQPKTASVGSMAKLIALFDKARAKLKYPSITLVTADGGSINGPNGFVVKLALAGSRSKYTGSIMVTDGGPFGANRFYGRIDPDGTWHQPFKQFDEMPLIERLLKSMADDPAKTTAEYGHLTGNCSFCHRPLKDERSTAVGYGSTCAKHYGLPWGTK